MAKESPLLTAVVVCRNEERNIARCLGSIQTSAALLDGDVEIVVVDSASEDRTREIALGFPVRLVELSPSWPLSPAAGRFHGGLASRGRYLLFIDGDMVLEPEWVPAAIRRLDQSPGLAGVTGIERQVFVADGARIGGRENPYGFPDREGPADVLPGSAIFRRTALEAVGWFDPYLSSEEEAEVCYRLSKAGFLLESLPRVHVEHLSSPRRTMAETGRRVRGRLYRGIGQVLRRSLSQGLFLRHAARLRVFLGFALFLFCGIIALLAWPATGDGTLLSVWLLALLVLFVLLAIRKRSPREAGLSLVVLAVIAWEALRGFVAPLPKPGAYPRDVRVREGTARRSRAGDA